MKCYKQLNFLFKFIRQLNIMEVFDLKALLKKIIKKMRRKRTKLHYRTKINNIIQNNPDLKKNLNLKTINQIESFWGNKISKEWHMAYSSVNEIEDYRYIPEDVFYCDIERRLNRFDMDLAYSDKNSYKAFLSGFEEPTTIIRNINHIYYNKENMIISEQTAKDIILHYQGELVIKPSIESGGGRNVRIFSVKNGEIYENKKTISIDALIDLYEHDFLVQEKIEQAQILNEIYPESLNTIRIMSYRRNEHIVILSSVIRFGSSGQKIDNQAIGGLSCGIKSNGKLNNFAIDKNGHKYLSHPYTGFDFKEAYIPNFQSIKSLTIMLHKQLKYFNLVSWDIALNENESPILIELNLTSQEINFHQFNNGPLFGDYTGEILKFIDKD